MAIRRRPEVTIKYAQTLDGRIATSVGDSRWISGIESRTLAHRLRAEHDAVLVGVGTVLADDPQLTVRLVEGRDPVRVVVDSRLRTPVSSKVLSSQPKSTLIATSGMASAERRAEIEALGAKVVLVTTWNGKIDLRILLNELAARDIRTVLVEGGSSIITSLLQERLADQVVVFIAPKIVGSGLNAVGDLGKATLNEAIGFTDSATERTGRDIVFTGRIRWDPDRSRGPGDLLAGSPYDGDGFRI